MELVSQVIRMWTGFMCLRMRFTGKLGFYKRKAVNNCLLQNELLKLTPIEDFAKVLEEDSFKFRKVKRKT